MNVVVKGIGLLSYEVNFCLLEFIDVYLANKGPIFQFITPPLSLLPHHPGTYSSVFGPGPSRFASSIPLHLIVQPP